MLVKTSAPRNEGDTINVLVVDDHLLLAETIVAALSLGDGLHAESVPTVEAALEALQAKGHFDVVLLDYDVPGMDGFNGLRRLIEANGGNVALFSGVASWSAVEQAMERGASGFIPKTLPLRTLRHAVRFIAEGEIYLPADYMRRASEREDGGYGLKPREMRVLGFVCQGMQNKEIGRELGLTEVIVKMDVKSICRKLGVRNRTEAALLARRNSIC